MQTGYATLSVFLGSELGYCPRIGFNKGDNPMKAWFIEAHRKFAISRTISALNSLSDVTLKDIGIPRGMITGHVLDMYAK